MMRGRLYVVLALVVAVSEPARADEPDAQPGGPDEAAGIEAYAAGDYRRAAEAFERAHRDSGRYQALFGWAQSERQLGHCQRARELYQKVFVHPDLPTDAAARVKLAMEQPCQQAPQADEPPAPTAEAEPPAQPVRAAPSPAEPATRAQGPMAVDRRPWYRDTVGGVLLGVGVVALAAGGYQLAVSFDTEDGVAALPTLPMQNDRYDTARRQRVLGIGGLALGGALVTGAVIRYLTHGRAAAAPVAAVAADGGVVVGYAGRF